MHKDDQKRNLIVGGARRIGDRCIIPIIRVLAMHLGRSDVVRLVPVALLFFEGEDEFTVLLPGAPSDTMETIGSLSDKIEQERKGVAEQYSHS